MERASPWAEGGLAEATEEVSGKVSRSRARGANGFLLEITENDWAGFKWRVRELEEGREGIKGLKEVAVIKGGIEAGIVGGVEGIWRS